MTRIVAAVAALGLLAGSVPAGAADSDPFRSMQWGLDRIRAPRAWAVTQGAGVTVAVVDTGVDLAHPDLAGRLLPGWDFVDDDDDPADEHGHGTLVAGIIAARRDNGIGIAGVAPKARILPVRALDADGRGDPGVVAAAIDYAVAKRAHVLNLSLSVENGDGLVAALFADRRVENAIEAAARAGVLVLIAAGNDPQGGQTATAYDAVDPEVLVVGASTRNDERAAYSNHGTGLDLVAPGGGAATDASGRACSDENAIVSTWWTASEGSVYGATCGTSMSTAFASGLGALLRAGGLGAAASAGQMLATVRDLGPPGRDRATGAGRIDAARAVGARAVAQGGASPTAPATPRESPPPIRSPRAAAPSDASPSKVPVPEIEPTDPVLAVPPAQAVQPVERSSPWVPLSAGLLAGAALVAVAIAILRRPGPAPRDR